MSDFLVLTCFAVAVGPVLIDILWYQVSCHCYSCRMARLMPTKPFQSLWLKPGREHRRRV